MSIFGRHRVRATFYHMVALVFLFSIMLWYFGYVSDKISYILTAILFIVDYVAEMYDPHPDNPGPWYSHFHRVIDDEGEDACSITTASKEFLRSFGAQ